MRTDFLLDENGALKIVDGDFVTGQSDDQNVKLLMTATKGTFKQFPLLGVGISRELNGTIDDSVKRRIRLNLDADGYKIKVLSNKNIEYEGNNG